MIRARKTSASWKISGRVPAVVATLMSVSSRMTFGRAVTLSTRSTFTSL